LKILSPHLRHDFPQKALADSAWQSEASAIGYNPYRLSRGIEEHLASPALGEMKFELFSNI
jgi:hypothetical protein